MMLRLAVPALLVLLPGVTPEAREQVRPPPEPDLPGIELRGIGERPGRPRLPVHLLPGPASGERIQINDNRVAAGRVEDGVLTLRLEARMGVWYPEGPEGQPYSVAGFGEEGRPLQNPGPLIRVSAGTEVRVRVRNSLAEPLTMFGFGERRGIAADSFRIDPGEAREARFTAAVPGTYYYAGRTTPVPVLFARNGPDSQLNGVIVVDPADGAIPSGDRIFVISWRFDEDSTSETGLAPGGVLAINGLSWPHTERFDVAQGDTLRWRWLSMTVPPHPMHLHGFYFRVDARGDGARDTIYAPEERRLAVTENLGSGQTMAITWSPERPGNWIFHCHVARHITRASAFAPPGGKPASSHSAHGGSAGSPGAPLAHDGSAGSPSAPLAHAMSRLVLGIRVKPRGEAARSSGEARPIRLLIRSRPAVHGDHRPGYAYVLGGTPEERDSAALPVPGPTLVLEKDRPVAINVVNRSHEPAAVHWHGIELESFPDGVPGWSGYGASLLPAIPPGDSLTVHFTPPRAGTFMYHSHFNEMQQIASGLYGAILVLPPGRRHDPETDRVLLFSDAGPTLNTVRGPFAPPLLNGRAPPEPIELRAGTTYRFRIINIRSDYGVAIALVEGDEPARWRHVAKDGADLPAAQAVVRPAWLDLGPGEIHDVEFTPRAPGELNLRFGFPPRFRPPDVVVPDPVVVPVRVRD